MLYLYDKAICSDLYKSFNSEHVDNPVVKVIDPEGMINLAAQIQNDDVTYPLVAVSRDNNVDIDSERYNFRRAKKGVCAEFDPKTNNYYYEKVIPIKLDYDMTVITTNQVDMDEIVRELIFKYSDQFFLTIETPYEIKRKIRFGIQLKSGGTVEYTSRTFEYLSVGTLYQAILNLECVGCVLLSYTPQHVKRLETEVADDRFGTVQ